MWSTSSRHCLPLLLALAGCSYVPAPPHPRPALPLPDSVAERYALDGPVEETSLVPIGRRAGVSFFRGQLRCGSEVADFHYLQPDQASAQPFVLCLPILAGGDELMWIIGLDLASAGYSVAWSERVASALDTGQRGAELEQLFRRTVIQNRMVLHWARLQPQIDPRQTACVGVSMGGIVATVLLAAEPQLRAAALCLAGGDLARLMMVSAEGRVVRWRRWRHLEDGRGGSELYRELETDLLSDPALVGPFIATDKVIMIGSDLDEVVPIDKQDTLWESLGRPARHHLPLGHYTAALAFGSIFGSVHEFLRKRFAAAAPVRLAASR